jgi:uncharacterized membrane protein YhaH (DUF805 family)
VIYKFIDNNGAVITVNTLSSLQALIESDTIRGNTKVKVGIRGKWIKAEDLNELKFKEKKIEEIPKKTEDIKSIITRKTTSPTEKEKNKNIKAPKVEIKSTKVEETPVQDTETTKVEETPLQDTETTEIEEKDIVKSEDSMEPPSEELISTTKETQSKTEEEKLQEIYADTKMEDINFFNAIKICFQKFFVFTNRASRSEYWWFILFYIISATIPTFVPNENVVVFGYIMSFLLFIPSIAVTVRRLHDINKSGWFIFISLIPILGSIIVLVMTIEKGTLGKNRFGEYPLKFKKDK